MAHKKAWGSTNNGRDSNSKRLWIKRFAWESVKSWNILARQKGNKWWGGNGTMTGKDFTIFSVKEGTVKFSVKKRTRFDWRIYKDTYVEVV